MVNKGIDLNRVLCSTTPGNSNKTLFEDMPFSCLQNRYVISLQFLNKIDLENVVAIAKEAGDAIMEIYDKDFKVEYKDDNSPLTEADLKSNEIIVAGLQSLFPEPLSIPIMSEKGKDWEYYRCIDPIDGTKEFIKKNAEFTVNIALMHKDTPVLGVVYAPALGDMYWAKKGSGAFKVKVDGRWTMDDGLKNAHALPPNSEPQTPNSLVIVAGKSHLSKETEEFIDPLTTNDQCPTMEWGTAAADAIARESGKMTYQYNSASNIQHSTSLISVVYNNKENLLNPWFRVR